MITINDRPSHDKFDNWEQSVFDNIILMHKLQGSLQHNLISLIYLVHCIGGILWMFNTGIAWCMIFKPFSNFNNKLLIAGNKNIQNAASGLWTSQYQSQGLSMISLWCIITRWGLRPPGECLPQCFLPHNFDDVECNVVFSCQRCNDVTALEDVKTKQWSWLWDIPLCEY